MFSYLQGIRPNSRKNTSSHIIPPQTSQGTRYGHHYAGSPKKQCSDNLEQPRLDEIEIPSPSQNVYTLPPISRVSSNHDTQNNEGGGDWGKCSYGPVVRPDGHNQTQRTDPTIDPISHEQAQTRDKILLPQDTESHLLSEAHRHANEHVQLPAPPSPTFAYKRKPTRLYTEPAMSISTSTQEDVTVPDCLQPSTSNLVSYQPTSSVANHVRHGKTKLNILNPMSLLARRRSAQPATYTTDTLSHGKLPSVANIRQPDDYDPRIRGKVVHDFSAPRPNRHVSLDHRIVSLGGGGLSVQQAQPPKDPFASAQLADSTDSSIERSALGPIAESPNITEKAHTPVFREHFGLETESWRFDEDDRRNQQTKRIMDQVPEHEHLDRGTASLPPFARNLLENVLKIGDICDPGFPASSKVSLEVVSEIVSSHSPPPIPTESPPATSPPKTRSRTTSNTDISFQSTGISKRMGSTASRFSFDLAGVGSSAQEKLLEERHRHHEALKAKSRMASGSSEANDQDLEEDEGYAYDDTDDFDGLEERIPGVNTDADEEHNQELDQGFDTAKPSPSLQSPTTSPVSTTSTGHTSVDSPFTSEKGTVIAPDSSSGFSIGHTFRHINPIEGQDSNPNLQLHNQSPSPLNAEIAKALPIYSRYNRFDEDDLYFDDGVIDDLDENEGQVFDESLFDDDANPIYGLPLRNIRPPMTLTSITGDNYLSPNDSKVYERGITRNIARLEDHQGSALPSDLLPGSASPRHHLSSAGNDFPPGQTYHPGVSLTQDNLAAYHHALTVAANNAVQSGRLNQKSNVSDNEIRSPIDEFTRAKVTFDDRPLSEIDVGNDSVNVREDSGKFNFDDNLEDDPIIAAANAEALENDDEGFYGQEFGFYAHATGAGDVEYANGGYFGHVGGIRRSHSGRADFQEPSLTPITERSEWSNRNSVVIHAMQGGYPQSLQNAGLAQLTDAMGFDEDSMSLSALMKLRRSAWAGSNVSLPSSTGSHKSGSPQTYIPTMIPYNISPVGLSTFHPAGSSHSLVSDSGHSSVDDTLSGSVTLTSLQTQDLATPPTHPRTEKSTSDSPDFSIKSTKYTKGLQGQGHSRNSSGAESVSYVKEVSDEGTGRWVLEKRRTAEGGQVEILGRQVVEGGRI